MCSVRAPIADRSCAQIRLYAECHRTRSAATLLIACNRGRAASDAARSAATPLAACPAGGKQLRGVRDTCDASWPLTRVADTTMSCIVCHTTLPADRVLYIAVRWKPTDASALGCKWWVSMGSTQLEADLAGPRRQPPAVPHWQGHEWHAPGKPLRCPPRPAAVPGICISIRTGYLLLR